MNDEDKKSKGKVKQIVVGFMDGKNRNINREAFMLCGFLSVVL
ncbi:hypothetical protein [Lederbergia panacisoli]|nr:hypothetical protein [Lederbergia panacisoli]MCR2822748.1 hypothetical protein [Lederbergia panacisoli]